jgi:hypothetical protein
MAISCSSAPRPGTFVRERVHAKANPTTTARTVATLATISVLPKMWA